MKKYDETYIDKAKCIKDGFIRTKKGVCKMTVLERLYHKGKLVDKEIVSTYYSLIKPNNLSYDPYCFKVHKIRPQRLYKEKR